MLSRGIRGAITVEENTESAIEAATVELLSSMINLNNLNIEDISHVFFSLTADLDAAFPAKYARTKLQFDNVPMLCYTELAVPGALKMCLRSLIVFNTEKSQREIRHAYLKGASILRPDIVQP